jgi:antitoxin (DNA-binding transcriptional repressor) of toxin-antitoxin stability system
VIITRNGKVVAVLIAPIDEEGLELLVLMPIDGKD